MNMTQFVASWDDHSKKPWPEIGPRGLPPPGICDYGLACNMTRPKEWHVSFDHKGVRTTYFQAMDMLLDIKDFLGNGWGSFVSECGRTVSVFDPSVADFIESECPYRGFSGQAGQR